MNNKFLLFYRTIKYLKTRQILFRIYYSLKNFLRKFFDIKYKYSISNSSVALRIPTIIYNTKKCLDRKVFTFLNITIDFKNRIDWNYSKFGKLWSYNLNYFDFLNQQDLTQKEGLLLINDFIDNIDKCLIGLEPYPISIRGINWIKFLSRHTVDDRKIDSSLYAQYRILLKNLEYHLLGNHLLENGFSLLFGAYYFNDQKLYKKAKNILLSELEEQILDDGAHFELSPMYHQIILLRLLDCLNIIKNNNIFNDEMEGFLETKAGLMLQWINSITLHNGQIPLFNDSARGIAPETEELNNYALELGLNVKQKDVVLLGESGYSKFFNENYEIIIDVGNIGPDYIPGHAHSDTFNFEMHYRNKPFIIDSGVSTYDNSPRRILERSTKAHNTVQVGTYEQTEVWSSFRVADRAKIIDLIEKNNFISASHTGYKKYGVIHSRKFEFENTMIIITDTVDSHKRYLCSFYLHFHKDFIPDIKNNKIIVKNIEISFDNEKDIYLEDWFYAEEFNKLTKSKMARIIFEEKLSTTIKI